MRWTLVIVSILGICGLAVGDSIASHEEPQKVVIRTDTRSIETGKELFRKWCIECHDVTGVKVLDGPSLKGILRNQTLPVSGKSATPDNVANQIRHPYKGMPLFRFSDEELSNLMAYLNTL